MKNYRTPETAVLETSLENLLCTSPTTINDLEPRNDWTGDGDIFND